MNYHKRDLKKTLARTARVFSFEPQHLPTEQSLKDFEAGLKHWPDFVSLTVTDTGLHVVLSDRANKLGRLSTDEELLGRLADLGCKLLVPQGTEAA